MTIKLALLDVDGTLRDGSDWQPGALEFIRRLGEANIPVSLNSARTPRSLRKLVEDIPEVTFIAGSGGAVVRERLEDGTWRLVAGSHLPAFVVQSVIEQTREAGIELWVFTAEGHWFVDKVTDTVRWYGEATSQKATVTDLTTFTDLASVTDPVVKMAIVPTGDAVRDYAFSLTDYEYVAVVQQDERLIDVVPDAAMRYKGGDAIVSALGILWGDVLAVGDGPNNIGMLAAAGTSYLLKPLTLDMIPENRRVLGVRLERDDVAAILPELDERLAAETFPLLPHMAFRD